LNGIAGIIASVFLALSTLLPWVTDGPLSANLAEMSVRMTGNFLELAVVSVILSFLAMEVSSKESKYIVNGIHTSIGLYLLYVCYRELNNVAANPSVSLGPALYIVFIVGVIFVIKPGFDTISQSNNQESQKYTVGDVGKSDSENR
jgi:glycerol uptake facilitator-like aquaporin